MNSRKMCPPLSDLNTLTDRIQRVFTSYGVVTVAQAREFVDGVLREGHELQANLEIPEAEWSALFRELSECLPPEATVAVHNRVAAQFKEAFRPGVVLSDPGSEKHENDAEESDAFVARKDTDPDRRDSTRGESGDVHPPLATNPDKSETQPDDARDKA